MHAYCCEVQVRLARGVLDESVGDVEVIVGAVIANLIYWCVIGYDVWDLAFPCLEGFAFVAFILLVGDLAESAPGHSNCRKVLDVCGICGGRDRGVVAPLDTLSRGGCEFLSFEIVESVLLLELFPSEDVIANDEDVLALPVSASW
jgi:hypothetical protein